MSREFEQPCFQVVPPIILDENGDVEAYPSVQAVIRHVEVVDILNGEYTFHDSTGRVLEAQVFKGKVKLVPTPRVEPDSSVLRERIVHVLSLLGVPEEASSGLPFTELSRLLFEKSKKRGAKP